MLVRYHEADRGFMEQATQIVVDEIETLERRITGFLPVRHRARRPARPGGRQRAAAGAYRIPENRTRRWFTICRLTDEAPRVVADQDLIKGILTNLFENAAEAAGEGGKILGVTTAQNGRIAIDVHDSGPG